MSDDTQNTTIEDNGDWFLQSLINIVNGKDLEIGITLNVGGFLVSGLLVSGHRYFEAFGQEFSSAFTETDVVQSIKESFSMYGVIYTQERSQDEDVPPPNYIHLRNAKFFNTNGNPLPGNRGVWWRGRVSEVSGFMLGNLSSDQA
jgi:hypothetical protein